ncbi:glycosyltransferase [Rhodoferax sp. 4810]|uniref:Glycosyltransferase n=1 Tax=Thiospirillum jenense TaxID=1653858 RepID=A0A839HD15_9GAMM|nr:glycosyltransferase [Thiospirillum jenense]MBB1074567.1 glycosyltransferase [Rhodoferax jenense]MBB1126541.1 glycosyltransferase [Thiospirillum jenense]
MPLHNSFSNQPPLITILVGSLGCGGIGKIMIDQCEYFSTHGMKIELITDQKTSPFDSQIPQHVRRVTLPNLHPLWSVFRLAFYLLTTKPHAVINHRPRLLRPLYLAIKMTRVRPRVISVIHTMLSPSHKGDNKPRKTKEIMQLTKCDALIAVSATIARDVENWLKLPAARVAVAYPVISIAHLQSQAQLCPTAPYLSEPPNDYLISVARLEPEKDLPTLLAAFAKLSRRYPTLELVLLGSGTQQSQLKQTCVHLGIQHRTHFAGFAINPYPWIARARLLVISSLHETFGLVLAEALALGVPVVSTNSGGPNEILDAGRYGSLVPPQDVDALTIAIQNTLDNPPAPVLLMTAVQRFTPAQHFSIYLTALGLNPANHSNAA